MPRKQVNVSFSPEDYERLRDASGDARVTPSKFCRDVVLEALDAEDSPETDTDSFPAWLIALLAFLRPRRSSERG